MQIIESKKITWEFLDPKPRPEDSKCMICCGIGGEYMVKVRNGVLNHNLVVCENCTSEQTVFEFIWNTWD